MLSKLKGENNIMEETKRCSGCKEVQPRSAFSLNKISKDGLNGQCKNCFHQRQSSPEYREKWNKYQREWTTKEKQKAHYNTHKRLKADKPDRCQICGMITSTLHFHHPDYSNPDFGIWLDVRCHKRINKQEFHEQYPGFEKYIDVRKKST